jgi:hypothetical protein
MRPAALCRTAVLLLAGLLLALASPPVGLLADEAGGNGPAPAGGSGPEGTKPGADEPVDPDDLFDVPTTFTKEQVDQAILKGVSWLKGRQGEDGAWPRLTGDSGAQGYGTGKSSAGSGAYPFPAGTTALALYTLLKCKVDPKDPVVKNGFAHIKAAKMDEPETSYESGMLLLALCATADQAKSTKASLKAKPRLEGAYRGWAQKLVDQVVKRRDRFKIRGFRYNHPGSEGKNEGGGQEDLSGTQIVALGLFSAHRVGIKVQPKVWEDILKYSMEQQDEDGPPVEEKDPVTGKVSQYRARGFSYIRGIQNPVEGKASAGMTACGIANVMMARFVLTDGGRKQEQWDKRPDAKKVQDSVYDGLAWLQAHWSPFQNAHPHIGQGLPDGRYNHYWHYALERAMDLVGRQKVGDHVWYSDIGQELINRQDPKGFWKNDSTAYVQDDFLDTCFSLLFLRRATKGNIPFPSVTGGSDEGPVDNR